MKYTIIYNIGKAIDNLLVYVFALSALLAFIGFIIEASWTMNAVYAFLFALGYSGFWFLFLLLFLQERYKKEQEDGMSDALLRAKKKFAEDIAKTK